MAQLLTAAGVNCAHEGAYNASALGKWGPQQRADSSWMAATALPLDVPVVLLVRHPLAVVRSWVEIGFFTVDSSNPTHGPLRRAAPWVYEHERPADMALAMWLALTAMTLAQAEMVIRLERLDTGGLARLLRWAGADPSTARATFRHVIPVNQHQVMKGRVGVTHRPSWDGHDPDLARDARWLAEMLGYDPEVIG